MNFESKKVYRTLLHPPAVNLQYFLCIITQFKDCYKVIQPTLSELRTYPPDPPQVASYTPQGFGSLILFVIGWGCVG